MTSTSASTPFGGSTGAIEFGAITVIVAYTDTTSTVSFGGVAGASSTQLATVGFGSTPAAATSHPSAFTLRSTGATPITQSSSFTYGSTTTTSSA